MKINLGNVTGLIRSVDPPTKTYVLWAKMADAEHPYDVELYHYVSGEWVKLVAESGDTVFTSDIEVILSGGKTLGKYVNGDTIPATGKTAQEVLNLIAQEYLSPTISAFIIQGFTSTIEVGTDVPAYKTFSWTTTQNSNIEVNSGVISERFGANIELANSLPNNNFSNITSQIDSRDDEGGLTWRLLFTNTQASTFQRDFTINWRYKIFYGPIDSNPTNSVEGRALPNERFTNSGNTWTLNTGTVKIKWGVLIPNNKSLVSVFDLDASNANITSSYILIGNINITDAGGNTVSYKLYVADAFVPYSINHRHEITIN